MYVTSNDFKIELDIREMKVLLQALDFTISLSNPEDGDDERAIDTMVEMAYDIAGELDVYWDDPREIEVDLEDEDDDEDEEDEEFSTEANLTPEELRLMGDALYVAALRMEIDEVEED